ncbi:MAG: helix-turn-helix domain-containing protein [Cellvibrionaceae bacterium]
MANNFRQPPVTLEGNLFKTSMFSPGLYSLSSDYLNPLKDPNDLLSHNEMCQELGISVQTGYDWRNPKSKRFKKKLAELAIYLSERTVRFRRADIQAFALSSKEEAKS